MSPEELNLFINDKKFEDMINTILNDDCLNILKQIPDNSIDLILTDPPYRYR